MHFESKIWQKGAFAILLLFIVLVYSNTFQAEFHFDDTTNISYQEDVRSFDRFCDLTYWLYPNNRPVATFTFALNYAIGGYDVIGYHLFNLLIHLINGLLVFLLIRRLLSLPKSGISDSSLAFFIAFGTMALFLVHPVQTQSVTYVVQRMNALAALFYLLSLLIYLNSRIAYNKSGGMIKQIVCLIPAAVLALAAVYTKQNAVTIPLVYLVFEIYFLRNRKNRASSLYIFLGSAIILLAFLYALFTGRLPSETDTIDRPTYLMTQFFVLLKYFKLTILPFGLNLDHDFPVYENFSVLVALAMMVHILLIALAVFLFKKHRLLSFGIVWFYIVISIESSFFPIRDVIFEHRLYLPFVGLFLVFCVLFSRLKLKRNILFGVFSLLILLLGLRTYDRNKDWKSGVSLWSDAAQKSPEKARVWCNLGNAYLNDMNFEAALINLEKAIEIEADYPQAFNNIGYAYKELGNYSKAEEYYKKALENTPRFMSALHNYGCLLVDSNRPKEALRYLKRAEDINPDYDDLAYNFGLCYQELEKYGKAIEYYYKSLENYPENLEAYNNLARCYHSRKQYSKAIQYYEKALQLGPNEPFIWNNLGNAYYYNKQSAKAIKAYKKALELDPDYHEAARNLRLVKKWTGL